MEFIYYLLTSLILGGACYLASNSLIISLSVFVLFFLYFLALFHRTYKKSKFAIKRYHECYTFINDFIIAYSIKGSLQGALDSCELSSSDELKKYMTGIEHLNMQEKIKYLKSYFPFDIYDLFLNILDLNVEQGGDVLESFTHLMKESREIEEEIIKLEAKSKNKLIEVIILWSLVLIVLLVMKFSLNQFFKLIVDKPYYLIAVAGFFIMTLIFLHITLQTIFKIRVKGYHKDEA